MKIALVLNSPYVDIVSLSMLKGKHFVIAVDGGLNYFLESGLQPQWIVGDFDSVTPGILEHFPGVPRFRFPVHKDQTDSELAIKLALAMRPEALYVYGLLGGKRFDHTLTNYRLLGEAAAKGCRVSAPGNPRLLFSCCSQVLNPAAGSFFSVLSLRDTAQVSISGAEYSGENLVITPSRGLGLGNRIIKKMARIRVDSGTICICQWESEFNG